MISVIICSPDSQRAQTISQHVAATIGVPHELLLVPNAAALGGMCAAYNQAAASAQYDLLCFMHDDVELHTPGWGQRVQDHFAADAGLGLIGLAGSRYKSAALSGWASGQPAYDCCNVLQTTPGAPARVWMHPGNAADLRVPVKTLDGVWLCTRKTVWQQTRFSSVIPGFHFYDIDFSLRASQHFTAAVVYDIDLLHFSPGNFGDAWVEQAIRFHQEWNTVPLPVSLDAAPAGTETAVQRFWLNRLLKEAISAPLRRRWLALNAVAIHPALWKEGLKFFIFPAYHRFKNGTTS
ncbi:Glycosyltransferase like family protein [Chitinophaga costaii]|uniref:Glycosyltransferase like family protein n=1 Tax=Chitinophaga costaii TaxID=1335309 RepID=A0A1C4ECR0_9BACT|nr:glycosyltransferase [Chitinophaga costaii]PUZ23908.1 hypothetical protein DCM91_14055 [Chitinophaga costaii]SCC41331.1 Glycosyltransferase like family protein [Chitinophaga costaii]